jgi:hypothetical protein
MAEVALIVIVVLAFFIVGFAVGVRIVGIVGRWWKRRSGRNDDREPGRRP